MKRPKTGLIIIDLIISIRILCIYGRTKACDGILSQSTRYLIGFGITLFLWMVSSFYFKKYMIIRGKRNQYS